MRLDLSEGEGELVCEALCLLLADKKHGWLTYKDLVAKGQWKAVTRFTEADFGIPQIENILTKINEADPI